MSPDERFELWQKILDRAMEFMGEITDRVTLMMDLHNADKNYHLRLQEFLEADEMDFVHDICGIHRHMDRRLGSPTYGKCLDFFVPRFAGKDGE